MNGFIAATVFIWRAGGGRIQPRRRWEFAPHSQESLILPSRGANILTGRASGGGVSLRPIPGKALFYRRGAQTLRLEKPPAAVGVCAPPPGKPYSSVGGAQTLRLEKPPAGMGVCAPLPGKPYSSVGGAQTLRREEPPEGVEVCAPPPGKPYSTVEGRKPCARQPAHSNANPCIGQQLDRCRGLPS